jgi:DNA-binding XRE family transcriptional regulator
MDSGSYLDLKTVRAWLGLTQTELAHLLGVSVRTVQACEQGWRNPSPSVERSCLLLLMVHANGPDINDHTCWETMGCEPEEREDCLVYRTEQGHLCWLLSGQICKGVHLGTWEDKKSHCGGCEFFLRLFPEGIPTV